MLREAICALCGDGKKVRDWPHVADHFDLRWAIEVTFHDSKQHLGFEQPRGWTRKATQRTAPIAMLLHMLAILWFDQHGRCLYQPTALSWYRHKTDLSFADMLAALEQVSIRQEILGTRLTVPSS